MSYLPANTGPAFMARIETVDDLILVYLIACFEGGSVHMLEIFDNDGAGDAQRADTYAHAIADAHGCAVVHV